MTTPPILPYMPAPLRRPPRPHRWRPNIVDVLAIYQGRWPGGRAVAEPLRVFADTDSYGWLGFSMPDTRNASVPANGSFEDQVSVPPLSFLLMISGVSDQVEGFRFQIDDKGTRAPVASQMMRFGVNTNRNAGAGIRVLPYILPSPYAVAYPGLLAVRVTNLSAVANNLQLVLHFAVPKRK